MNELMERAARLWLTNRKEILSNKRHRYINNARHAFVLLALLSGYSREKIAEFTGWTLYRVDYYAGKAISDEEVLSRMKQKGVLSIEV